MKMYIGDSDFLYKSLVRNTDKETVECLMPYLEFTKHINDMKIISCNGIVYMRSIDALTRRIQTVQSNMVINLAVNLN
jgi:polynucleotide 5'-kinase involved in rRNA processing